MNTRDGAARMLMTILLGLVLAVPAAEAAPSPAIATPAASGAAKVVIFNMYPSPLVQPKRVFFQANSGPYLDALQWAGWGDDTTTGTGVWALDCSNGGGGCSPGDPDLTTYPARYVLSDLGPCPRLGASAQSYRKGVVEVDRNGGTDTIPFASDYDFCAKRPTAAASRAAVKRYVQRRLHGTRITVACHVTGATDLECKARWTRGGKSRSRGFFVFSDMQHPVIARPMG